MHDQAGLGAAQTLFSAAAGLMNRMPAGHPHGREGAVQGGPPISPNVGDRVDRNYDPSSHDNSEEKWMWIGILAGGAILLAAAAATICWWCRRREKKQANSVGAAAGGGGADYPTVYPTAVAPQGGAPQQYPANPVAQTFQAQPQKQYNSPQGDVEWQGNSAPPPPMAPPRY